MKEQKKHLVKAYEAVQGREGVSVARRYYVEQISCTQLRNRKIVDLECCIEESRLVRVSMEVEP